ncbi:MAG TPA: MarR family transcriptional regulator [Streptosporangiaceae bacterium]|jgi:DNA-binding MarR family transcriptional regulator|nr:MarR family transcriptional regulator [Streptosporangiaceae bacterium]
MDALDLIMLGRRLSHIGEQALRGSERSGGSAGRGGSLSPGALLILRDVLAHPGTSITDIAVRTALPQGHVSETVTRLRSLGIAQTSADPADGRRTLVDVTATHLRRVASNSTRNADSALRAAFGNIESARAQQLIDALGEVAGRLRTS